MWSDTDGKNKDQEKIKEESALLFSFFSFFLFFSSLKDQGYLRGKIRREDHRAPALGRHNLITIHLYPIITRTGKEARRLKEITNLGHRGV